MRVLITKDKWGVQVWKADVEVDYKDEKWLNKKVNWFKRNHVFSNRFVAKNFPTLAEELGINNGEKRFCKIHFFNSWGN